VYMLIEAWMARDAGDMKPADIEIVREVVAGDADAFRVLVERYQGVLFRVVLIWSTNDVEGRAGVI